MANVLERIQDTIVSLLATADGAESQFTRPAFDSKKQSSIPGLYIIGDLAGAPVIKLAMADGFNVIEEIDSKGNAQRDQLATDGIYDVIIVGAGAAGLNAALAAQDKGLSNLVIEKAKIAETIENFPEGKYVYAEPDTTPAKGKLWLDGATKEDLIERWHSIIEDNKLSINTGEELTGLSKGSDGVFELTTDQSTYKAGYVVLATGQRGNPRKLDVPGEERAEVYHRLYSPKKYKDEDILVIGGGNSAVEAAVSLSEQNRVLLSYRKSEFGRVFKDNRDKLATQQEKGAIEVVFNSQVTEFGEGNATLEISEGPEKGSKEIPYHHAFVLIGAELPVAFLKKLGLRLENEWTGNFWSALALTCSTLFSLSWYGGGTSGFAYGALAISLVSMVGLIVSGRAGNRFSYLGLSFLVWHAIYGIKVGKGQEFWPFTGWGYSMVSFFDRPWSFWYTVIYTALMTVFGISAMKRWGLDRKDRFQIWRYVSLISFQWIMFFIVPEYLFQKAVEHRWVGEALANDPQFAEQAWRSYGLVYAWPLFFYTFFYDPHQIWVVWGVLLTFVIIPILVLFHGKRYCSWICGCGGLAETFGDRWRHLAPKGKKSIAWEKMGTLVLIFASIVTLGMLFKDTYQLLRSPTDSGLWFYRVIVDVWLVGIIPVTLYPFLGGKVWCRYWCPLAKMMQLTSSWWSKRSLSHFSIDANDKCISCGECSRYCQVGIDVMSYALKQEKLDNVTSSCIGCGICVTVCPMDTLSFGGGTRKGKARLLVV